MVTSAANIVTNVDLLKALCDTISVGFSKSIRSYRHQQERVQKRRLARAILAEHSCDISVTGWANRISPWPKSWRKLSMAIFRRII